MELEQKSLLSRQGDGNESEQAFYGPVTPMPSYNSVAETKQDTEARGCGKSPKEGEADDTDALPTSNLQSLMHLIKGNVGTGVLAIPLAVKNAGLWVGFGGLVVMGIVTVHCMHLLVKCAHHLCKRSGRPRLDYGEVVEAALCTGPLPLQRFSSKGKTATDVIVCIVQFGLCITYVLFIADNVKEIVESYVAIRWSINIYLLLLLCLLVPYAFIKHLRYLAPFSLLANFLSAIGFVIILQFCIRYMQPVSNFPASSHSLGGMALFFGTAVFAFEGIGVVLPIENRMKTPEAFGGWNGVLNTGMVIVTVLYVATGFYGYLAFGDEIRSSVTINLPSEEPLYLTVQIFFVASMLVTYGLQLYVPVSIIWPVLSRHLGDGLFRQYGEYALRFIFVLFTFVLASIIPHLDLMISLVGAFASSLLAVIFPPVLEIITFWPVDGFHGILVLVKNSLVCIFGLVGFVTGTAVSLLEIKRAFQEEAQ